jgi:predicted thioesterase
MQELIVILQDGFDDDDITITVNGKEARHDREVSTRLLIGMAEEVSVELPAKGATVGVEVNSRNLRAEKKLVGRPRSLLVSIENGKLVLREGTGREAFL